jgi:hypothetical protein
VAVRRTDDEPVVVPEARTAPPIEDDETAGAAAPATLDESTLDESALDERALAMLAFEKQWWKHAGAKEQAIREQFDLSATRYYQLLNALLDDPRAAAHDPTLVARLRRLRASRTRRSG